MKISWVQILIGVIIGIVGCFYFMPKPKQPEAKIVKVRVEIHDTTYKYKEIASTADAKTRYVPAPGIPGTDPAGNNIASLEKVSYWDTSDSKFIAHVEYWHKANIFKNDFFFPEITITNIDSSSETITSPPVIIKELPRWEIGIGLNTRLMDSKLSMNPFASLTYNKKILFFNTSIEFRGLADFKNGSISLSPEVEGKIKISL